MKNRIATLVLLLLAALPLSLPAQRATGSVAGTVTDSTGGTIPGAKIVVLNLATGIERTVSSNEAGFYSATALPAGRYSIKVSKEGFSTYGIPEVTLQVDQNATANIQLQVGTLSETVSVVGTVSEVDIRTATLNTVITKEMMTDLPLNGRNVLQLLRVTPGTLSTTGTINQGATRPEAGSELVSASGGRGNSTTFVMDGGIHEDPYTEVSNVLPNPDAVQEIQLSDQ